jgi:hypothetical protein
MPFVTQALTGLNASYLSGQLRVGERVRDGITIRTFSSAPNLGAMSTSAMATSSFQNAEYL